MFAILRSGPFRIALVFAAGVTVTTYLVLGVVYLHYYSANVLSVRTVLQDEVQKVQNAPIGQLRQQLGLRLTQDLRHLDYVGLYDRTGDLTFGNVERDLRIPQDGAAHVLVTQPPEPEDHMAAKAVFVSVARPDGGRLVLGRSLIYAEQLQTAMLKGSAVAVIPVILLALLTGTIISLRASRRLAAIRTAINRVMRGELQVRLPVRGKADDIDALVLAVNLMLDEIVRLLHQIKSVGDNIAHDLRAPLAVMRARLERGLAGLSEDVLRGLTTEALGDLERAMTTVTALLRISELESGLRRSAFDSVDLALVCRDAFDLYEPLAEARGVGISVDAPFPVVVTGDGDLLREALANLVDNAIKFTPSGGRVVIACGVSDSLMRVCDTGPGIAPGERDKVIKRFYRASDTRGVPGVGLGLSMAVTIVELHGFGLRIRDNAPGTIFEITPEPIQSRPSGDGDKTKGTTSGVKSGRSRRTLKRNLVEAADPTL